MLSSRTPSSIAAAVPSLALAAALTACTEPSRPTAASTPSVLASESSEPTTDPGLSVYGVGAVRRATPQSPCAEGAFRQFDFWVGDWVVSPTVPPPPPAPTPRTPSHIATALDGCAILETWGGGGRSLNSYDPETGLWYQTWVPGPGRPFRMAGGLRPDGVMALEGTRHPYFAPTASWIDAYTWTPVDANHVVQAWTFDALPSGFHLQGSLDYTRTATPLPMNPPSTARCQAGGEAAETRLLDFTVGRWAVSASNGLPLGTTEIALDATLGGCLLEETFTTPKGYATIGWMYYDPVENAFYRSSVDSEGERVELRGPVTSSPISLEGAEPVPGAPGARVRLTWTAVSADELRQTWEVATDAGASWRVAQTLVFTRR